ncbi:MAG TPA: DUF167 domain-containing protein [Planctomycetota bacterium]|nr:DUF167 domain-containing protein [Planctomycetota bacterium]
MMIEISSDPAGISIKLRVQPKASAERIIGQHAGALKLAVTAPPEDGKANEAAVRLLAKKLRVPRRSISITAGAASRNKVIHIDNMTAEEFIELLQ